MITVKCFLPLIFLCSFCFARTEISESEMFETGCKLYADGNHRSAFKHFQEFIDEFPESDKREAAFYLSAICLKNTPEAVSEWKGFIKKFHDGKLIPSARHLLAQVHYHRKEYPDAVDIFKSLLKKYPRHFLEREIKYGLGVSHLSMENWKDSEGRFLELMLEEPAYYGKKESIKYFLGVANYHQERYGQAVENFKTVKSTAGLYLHGRSLEKLKKHISAMAKFKELLVKHPRSELVEPSRFLIAECFFKSGDYLSAAEEYEKLLAGFPYTSLKTAVMCRIACCHYKREDYAVAIKHFKTLLQEYPDSPFAAFAQYMIGESRLKGKDTNEAIKAYTMLINKYPEFAMAPQSYYKIGWCYYKEGNYLATVGILNQFLERFPNHDLIPEALFLSADSHTKDGKPDMAIDCYRKVLDIVDRGSTLAEASLYGIIKTYYDRKSYHQVATNYNYVLNNFPPSDSIWRGSAYLLVAEAQYNLGNFTEAKKTYSWIIKNHPRSDVALYAFDGKAYCYFQEKEFELARKERERFMKSISVLSGTSPVKAANEFELGKIYYNQKKYAESLDFFEKFMKGYPESPLAPEAIYYAGRAYYRLQYYTQAIKTWENLISSHKEHKLAEEAARRIADTYFRAQKYGEAAKAYRRIVSDYPSSDGVKRARLRIAHSFYNAQDDKRAIREFVDFMTAYPEDPLTEDALEGLIMASYRLGEKKIDFDIAGILAKFLEKFPESPLAGDVQYQIAEQLYEKKEFAKAAGEFRKVFSSYSGGKVVDNAHFYMAESYYYAKKHDEAVLAYERFTKNFTKHESISLAYLHWANSLFYLNDFAKAAEVYQELAKLGGIDRQMITTALINTSLCYKKAGKIEEAALINRKFIETYPDHEKVNDMSLELAENFDGMSKHAEAIDVYSKLMGRLKPGDELKIEIQYRIGEDWVKCDRLDKALEAWEKLKKAKPLGNSWRVAGLVKLAQEYEKLKKYSDAILAYKEIIRGAGSELASVAKSRLETLRQLQEKQ